MIKKLLLWILKDEYKYILEDHIKMKKHLTGLYEHVRNLQADNKHIKNLLIQAQKENSTSKQVYDRLFENTDVTVDADIQANYGRSDSWAIISIQGEREDFVRFIDLSRHDIQEISHFLRQFRRGKVDAEPRMRNFLMGDSGLASGRTIKRIDRKIFL